MKLTKACKNCMHYKEMEELSADRGCDAYEHFPDCKSFLHFFDTWRSGMQADAMSLIEADEINGFEV